MDKADAPRGIPAPPIEELLDAALVRALMSTGEPRRQVKQASTLWQRDSSLQVRAEQVAHLESVIHEVRDASQRGKPP